jgi:tRNA pseudouridine38-40 synthase
METFKLVISYDGSGYHGWQRQKTDRSIQAEVERALTTMTGSRIRIMGSGRTDAGVHAMGQVASFQSDAGLSQEDYWKGLNSLLPDDILILRCDRMQTDFHARYDTRSKHYQYRILNRDLPSIMERHYVWHIKRKLNLVAMQTAAACLVGRHDFKAFEGTGSPRSTTVREVFQAQVHSSGKDRIHFDIEADGFLRYMVRNIVGTLVEAGKEKIPVERVREILESKDRGKAGATAPARGLFLMSVQY